MRSIVFGILCTALLPLVLSAAEPPSPPPALDVRFVTDEAEAVLAILGKRGKGEAVTDEDWRRLFTSEGYTRLAKRASSMGHPLQEEDFKAFVLIADACDPRKLLASYNEASRRRTTKGNIPVLWSDQLLRAVGALRNGGS